MKLTIAIIAALTATMPAQAQQPNAQQPSALQPSALIKYADLDLASPAGQAELERRIGYATRKICRAPSRTGSNLPDTSDRDRCLANARQQISEQLAR